MRHARLVGWGLIGLSVLWLWVLLLMTVIVLYSITVGGGSGVDFTEHSLKNFILNILPGIVLLVVGVYVLMRYDSIKTDSQADDNNPS